MELLSNPLLPVVVGLVLGFAHIFAYPMDNIAFFVVWLILAIICGAIWFFFAFAIVGKLALLFVAMAVVALVLAMVFN